MAYPIYMYLYFFYTHKFLFMKLLCGRGLFPPLLHKGSAAANGQVKSSGVSKS